MKEGEINQVTAFMLYMCNKWCESEAHYVFGENLGDHIYGKYRHYMDEHLGTLFWYSELDSTRRRQLVARAIELYGEESTNK